jgi:two-component system, NtrC family, sensor kinase
MSLPSPFRSPAPPAMTLLQHAATVPDNRLLFVVSVVVVASVVLFTSGVVFTLLRRSDRRRAEEEKLAAMGTATARILHQIKNPLQTIVLHADLLQDDRMVSDRTQRRELTEAIVTESQRLVAMLDELSVYAAGSQRALNRQPLALDQLVRQVVALEALEGPGGCVRLDADRIGPASVFGDEYYLQQALDNLVRNAREAMAGQADASLEVSLQTEGGDAVLRVADTGPGIPEEQLARIFEPFVSTKGKGMGLGLAICREIVEAHAGSLELATTVGRGTTFTVRIPLHEAGTTPAPGRPAAGGGVGAVPWS